MILSTLVPNPHLLRLEGFISHPDSITISMRSSQRVTACPKCNHPSKRIHSRYIRHLLDLPWHGVAVKVSLKVRKFFCDNGACSRRIFTERLPEVVEPYGRKTLRLERVFVFIGYASGGEEGARISRKLSVPISADTLLRAVRKTTPSKQASPPRVVGVDEFAFRKGYRYGTIIVDLEKGEVIDLLPDRNADKVASWLRDHPQIEIISRDRSGSFSEAAGRGAPQAIQVADRWHLLKNMGEALAGFVLRNAKLLMDAAKSRQSYPAKEAQIEGESEPVATKAKKQALERRERRLERYNEIMHLRTEGVNLREIARRVGVDRRTVRRFVRSDGFPERSPRNGSASILDPFKPYLLGRWEAGCSNAARLHHEIARRGYRGGATTVRQFLARLRQKKTSLPEDNRASPRLPSVRKTAYLLTRESLEGHEKDYLTRLFALNPQLEKASSLGREFTRMVKARSVHPLEEWIDKSRKSGIEDLKSFADGLLRDGKAVKAALTLQWSNGQVEGQVNRLKVIKRQMYGRAKFDLLRMRVLHQHAV